MKLFRIENLSFTYNGSALPALSDISLEVGQGDFIVLYGKSGCGKTTLLRQLKPELIPFGERLGDVFFGDVQIKKLSQRTSAEKIAYVPQDPDLSIVTQRVWKELAFTLENLGAEQSFIHRRIAECCEYFGISELFMRDTASLSGGEKKLVSLACALSSDPDVLLLDEPFSQLDPISSKRLFSILHTLNKETGITVILSTHELEDAFADCKRLVVLDSGKISYCGKPIDAPKYISDSLIGGFPAYIQILHMLSSSDTYPESIIDAKAMLSDYSFSQLPMINTSIKKEKLMEVKNLFFAFDKKSDDVLCDISFDVHKGEVFTILGSNGSGKTTLIKTLSALLKPYSGKIRFLGQDISKYKGNLYKDGIAYLPQNPRYLFSKDNVRDELFEIADLYALKKDEAEKKIDRLSTEFNIKHLLDRHPKDISGGEAQSCALCKILMQNPRILLLDEPSKGLDCVAKKALISFIRKFASGDNSVIIVTHDTSFAAEASDTCTLLFNGALTSSAPPRIFLSENRFYSSSVNKTMRDFIKHAVTLDDVSQAHYGGDSND